MPIYARTSSGEYKPLDAVYARNSSGEIVSLPAVRNQNGSVFEVRTVDAELPVTLKTNGSYIQSYKLRGKTIQSGTPTPDNPIMPEFVGERTENLFDYSTITTGYRIVWGTGALYADTTGIISDFIEVTEGLTYSISDSTKLLTANIIGYDQNKGYLGVYNSYSGFVKTPANRYSQLVIPQNSGCKYIKLMTFGENPIDGTSMLTSGATASSEFIPYGYKIPITCAGQATSVYLGQTPTVRRVKKLILTGEERSIAMPTESSFQLFDVIQWGDTNGFCSHYPQIIWAKVQYASETGFAMRASSGGADRFRICDRSITTVENFRAYLAAQYAAGTPVTVWYVLTEPETGIVNEPLAKIGDYTDEVYVETPRLKTVSGTTTVDSTLSLKPSVSLTGQIRIAE